MEYEEDEHNKVIKYQNRLKVREEEMLIIINDINLLKEEKDNESDNSKRVVLEKQINKLKKQLTSCKISVGVTKRYIMKIAGKEMCKLDIDLLLIILNYLHNDNLINIIFTSKKFYNIVKNGYSYNILNLCSVMGNITFKIPTWFLENNSITLEQILYVPLSPEGRSLIHLLVRNNKVEIIEYLYKLFPNLNVNVETTVEKWTPVHNAINVSNEQMIKLLLNIGVNYYKPLNSKVYRGNIFNNIVDYQEYIKIINKPLLQSDENIKYLLQQNLENSIDDNIKTPINSQSFLDDEYMQNILKEIYKIIENYNIYNYNIYDYKHFYGKPKLRKKYNNYCDIQLKLLFH